MKRSLAERAFLLIFGVANVGLVLYGALLFWQPETLFAPLRTWPALTEGAPYLLGLSRLLGHFNAAAGIVGLYLIVAYYRSGQEALRRAFVLSTMLSFLGPMTFDNTVGELGPAEIVEHILFGAMLLISIVVFLQRKGKAPGS